MPGQALYYPWIDISHEGWLKNALLYWDSVRTIVPESIAEPYSTDTARRLQDAGFLVPLRVHSGMDELHDLVDDVSAYIHSQEAAELMFSSGPTEAIHIEKLSSRLLRLPMHRDKLGFEVLRFLGAGHRGEWLSLDRGFAEFYMTLLATRLAERVGATPVTPSGQAERLSISIRSDAGLGGLVPWRGSDFETERHWLEREAYGPRRRAPRTLVPGLLAQVAIEQIGIDPTTSVTEILEFRQHHREELALFRARVEQLAETVSSDLPLEALRERIQDLHSQEVAPALTNLKAALQGRRIKFLADGLLKVAFMSTSSSALMIVAGMGIPVALLAGAGLSLVVQSALYSVERRDALRANPYSYLLSVERELSR